MHRRPFEGRHLVFFLFVFLGDWYDILLLWCMSLAVAFALAPSANMVRVLLYMQQAIYGPFMHWPSVSSTPLGPSSGGCAKVSSATPRAPLPRALQSIVGTDRDNTSQPLRTRPPLGVASIREREFSAAVYQGLYMSRSNPNRIVPPSASVFLPCATTQLDTKRLP